MTSAFYVTWDVKRLTFVSRPFLSSFDSKRRNKSLLLEKKNNNGLWLLPKKTTKQLLGEIFVANKASCFGESNETEKYSFLTHWSTKFQASWLWAVLEDFRNENIWVTSKIVKDERFEIFVDWKNEGSEDSHEIQTRISSSSLRNADLSYQYFEGKSAEIFQMSECGRSFSEVACYWFQWLIRQLFLRPSPPSPKKQAIFLFLHFFHEF